MNVTEFPRVTEIIYTAPSDVQLRFSLNVTASSGPYYMDKVRFED